MCVDHFLLPRLYGISRPLDKVPGWSESGFINWPAVIALAITVVFGAYATGIMPGEDPNRYWGPATLIAWVMAAVLYAAFVAIVRSVIPRAQSLKAALGFSKLVADVPYPSSAVIDLATLAEGASHGSGGPAIPAAFAGGGLADA
jgi:hypothetical protein